MKNLIEDSFDNIYFGDFLVPHIIVYQDAVDYPGRFLARVYEKNIPTPFCIIGENLAEIYNKIPRTFHNMGRSTLDAPHIVCTFSYQPERELR